MCAQVEHAGPRWQLRRGLIDSPGLDRHTVYAHRPFCAKSALSGLYCVNALRQIKFYVISNAASKNGSLVFILMSLVKCMVWVSLCLQSLCRLRPILRCSQAEVQD